MLNQVVLVGRIAKGPELKETEKGKKVASILLAVPRSFKNIDGEYETDFLNCSLWDGVATNVCEYCKTGDLVGTLLLVMQYFFLILLDSFKYQISFQIVDFCYL